MSSIAIIGCQLKRLESSLSYTDTVSNSVAETESKLG